MPKDIEIEGEIAIRASRPRLRILACACVLTIGCPPERATGQTESADRWKLSAELSLTDQSGNRELRLFTGGLRVTHLRTEVFELEASLQSRYGRSEDELVARNHYASLGFDLFPGRRWSPFVFGDAERDPFKRLDVRSSGGAGAKYTPYRAEGTAGEASVSLAALYSYTNFTPAEDGSTLRDRSLARWSLRLRGRQQLRPGVELEHVSFYQPVWDEMADYLLRSETGIKVLLSERLALSVEYQFNRTARPPTDVEPDDRLFKTGVIVEF